MSTQENLVGPLYEQVVGRLRHRIASGEWDPGVPLPSEVHLSHEFGVSVGTMRKALDVLVKQRLVRRQRGRGTFVHKNDARFHPICFRGIDSDPLELEFVVSHHCIATPSPTEAAMLRLGSDRSCQVLRITREWRNRGKITCRETLVVDPKRFPNLVAIMPAELVLHETYARVYNTPVDRSLWTISSTGIDANGDPDLNFFSASAQPVRIDRVAFTADDVPIEFAIQTVALAERRMQFVV